MSRSNHVTLPYRVAAGIARTSIRLVTRDDWHGLEHLPREGGFLVCANHLSHADPFALAKLLLDTGHPPYFLAKQSLFELPVLGRLMTRAEQIPVARGTVQVTQAYGRAVQAVDDGRCVVVLPEGTLTKDPDRWPMTGKTGAARIALATGRPVIPVGQWGAQRIRHREPGHGLRVRSSIRVGPPVPLDDLRGRPLDRALLDEATHRIMDGITAELAQLRGETAPAGRWDRAAGRRVEAPRRGTAVFETSGAERSAPGRSPSDASPPAGDGDRGAR